MYTYAYLAGTVIPLSLWILFFLLRKDLRVEMVIIGTNVALMAVFTDFMWYLKDYWHPIRYMSVFNFLWQEVLYAFILGGIMLMLILAISTLRLKKNSSGTDIIPPRIKA